MPDMAVQAGPRDDFADDAREDVGDHAPEQEARNDHTEQIKFVFHATSLLCSVSCGSCLGASGKSAQRIPVSPISASLRASPAGSCNVNTIVLSGCPTISSGNPPTTS